MLYSYSTKQANAIFRAWKSGKIEAEKGAIDLMYHFAKHGISSSCPRAFRINDAIRDTVAWIFEGEYEKAQKRFAMFALDAASEYEMEKRWA